MGGCWPKYIFSGFRLHSLENMLAKQARKLQATLEGCNPKLSLTVLLAHRGKV